MERDDCKQRATKKMTEKGDKMETQPDKDRKRDREREGERGRRRWSDRTKKQKSSFVCSEMNLVCIELRISKYDLVNVTVGGFLSVSNSDLGCT